MKGQTYYYAVDFLHLDHVDADYNPFFVRSPLSGAVALTACCPVSYGTNLWVNYGSTPLQLAKWLMGTNHVTIMNATYTGAPQAIGIFGNGNGVGLNGHQFPFDQGVILSSGSITNAIGTNNDSGYTAANNGSSSLGQPGDTNLDDLVGGGPTLDAAVLEFDIVATNSFTMTFQYIFASEEYPEYIGSPPNGFNDPMAIFVTTNRMGANWIITTNSNIALVPGTTNVSVSVNTINGGGTNADTHIYVFPTNPQYYVDNGDPQWSTNSPVFNIQYDGFTTNLTVHINVIASITNHIKIATADYAGIDDSDDVYDSAIFLKASISCP